jgi:hypothetical protein
MDLATRRDQSPITDHHPITIHTRPPKKFLK